MRTEANIINHILFINLFFMQISCSSFLIYLFFSTDTYELNFELSFVEGSCMLMFFEKRGRKATLEGLNRQGVINAADIFDFNSIDS